MSESPVSGKVLELGRQPSGRAALVLLSGRYRVAAELGCPPWDFALDLQTLRKTGVDEAFLEALVGGGFGEWVGEGPGDAGPCLMLTPAGVVMAGGLVGTSAGRETPFWDPLRRELRFREVVVKRLERRAPNQECVLEAFQVAGWQECVPDPLPPEGDAKELAVRLSDTVKYLNRDLTPGTICFRVTSNGRGVRWGAIL